MADIEYDRLVEWDVAVDNRKRTPRYRHSCHQCGLIVVTWSKNSRPKEVDLHERRHQIMWGIAQAEKELEDVND